MDKFLTEYLIKDLLRLIYDYLALVQVSMNYKACPSFFYIGSIVQHRTMMTIRYILSSLENERAIEFLEITIRTIHIFVVSQKQYSF